MTALRAWPRLSAYSVYFLVVAVALSAASCRGRTTPAVAPSPSPTALAPVTAAAEPAVATGAATTVPTETAVEEAVEDVPSSSVSTGVTAGPTTFTSPRFAYSVALPCCWVALPSPAAEAEAALAGLQLTPDSPAPDEVLAQVPVETLELVAILPDAGESGVPAAQLTVSVLPSAGLTLAQYLEATSAELGAIANMEVRAARLDLALHPDNQPAAVIEYRANGSDPVAGLQVVFVLDDPANLLVLTFTTGEPEFGALLPEFNAIIRQIIFAKPA